MNVGIVGLGLMGSAMAEALLKSGHTVRVYNRTQEKAKALVGLGAVQALTPREAAEVAEVVITMVTDPAAVVAVSLGNDGILAGLPYESVHCDMSTVAPTVASKMSGHYHHGSKRFVQSPVLGSVAQIQSGKLLVLAGGDSADIELCRPVWRAFGEHVWTFDAPEKAASAKLACNMLIAHMIVGLGQSLLFAEKSGVAPAILIEILQESALGCMMYGSKGKNLLARDFSPNFVVSNLLKDLTLASDAAAMTKTPLPLNAPIRELFISAVQMGYGDEDYSAVVKVLETLAGAELRG